MNTFTILRSHQQDAHPIKLLISLLTIIASCLLYSPLVLSANYSACDDSDLASYVPLLGPGDTLRLCNRKWSNQEIRISANGSRDNPIHIKPNSPGDAVLSSNTIILS